MARVFAPRVSIPVEYRGCPPGADPDGPPARTGCGAGPADGTSSLRVQEIASRAAAAVHGRTDAGAMHALALVDMLWWNGSGKRLSQSISYLETAARLVDCPAPVLADLSAAYLVRAEHARSARTCRRRSKPPRGPWRRIRGTRRRSSTRVSRSTASV